LMENIPIGVALGPVLGAGLGSILGSRWEKQHGDPQQDEEQPTLGKWLKKGAILILLLGIIIIILLFATKK
jgi:hypothetical protein